MIFLDSWVWIEYFSEDKKFKEAAEILESVYNEDIVISTMILIEVKYRIAKKFDIDKSDRVINLIESFPTIKIIPVTKEVAKLAAEIRLKYYKESYRLFSYADAINLATALLTNCKIFYTGDPDFKGIEEIKTVII